MTSDMVSNIFTIKISQKKKFVNLFDTSEEYEMTYNQSNFCF